MIWNETFVKAQSCLVQGAVVSISGRLDKREDTPRLVANEVKPLKKPASAEPPVVLNFERARTTASDLDTVYAVARQFPGARRMEFHFTDAEGHRLRLRAGREFAIALTSEAEERLAPWLAK
jgi:DNA polymerase-3 subunit alpha